MLQYVTIQDPIHTTSNSRSLPNFVWNGSLDVSTRDSHRTGAMVDANVTAPPNKSVRPSRPAGKRGSPLGILRSWRSKLVEPVAFLISLFQYFFHFPNLFTISWATGHEVSVAVARLGVSRNAAANGPAT